MHTWKTPFFWGFYAPKITRTYTQSKERKKNVRSQQQQQIKKSITIRLHKPTHVVLFWN